MKIRRAGFIALAAALVCGLPAAAQFEHPDLKSGKKVVRTVLVLPPQVSVNKIGMKGGEGLIDESRQVETALPAMVNKALESKGLKPLEDPFSPAALENNSELKYAVADVQTQFDTLLEQVEKKPKDVRKARFSMGDVVTKLNPEGAADAVVFVRGRGTISTGGKKTFAILVGGPGAVDAIYLTLTVVDGRTGAVLFHTRSFATGNFVKEPGKLAKPILNSFKKFIGPPGAATKQAGS